MHSFWILQSIILCHQTLVIRDLFDEDFHFPHAPHFGIRGFVNEIVQTLFPSIPKSDKIATGESLARMLMISKASTSHVEQLIQAFGFQQDPGYRFAILNDHANLLSFRSSSQWENPWENPKSPHPCVDLSPDCFKTGVIMQVIRRRQALGL